MSPKADSREPTASSQESGVSGKWVIIGILLIAFVGAGASWLFRYNATHRAAGFWGPQAARLIRDAPQILFFRVGTPDGTAFVQPLIPLSSGGRLQVSDQRDVSKAGGIAHLRNALLEDRSFEWPARVEESDAAWSWGLVFMRVRSMSHSSEEPALIKNIVGSFQDDKEFEWAWVLFSKDCSQAMLVDGSDGKIISSEPIAAGLREVFTEFMKLPAPVGETAPAAEAASPKAAPQQ